MRANNLTISIPDLGCNKDCPYCISKMTPDLGNSWAGMRRNTMTVKRMASTAGVTSVLVTGGGEPLLLDSRVLRIGEEFHNFPLELQTNGRRFLEHRAEELIHLLHQIGYNIIAFSVDTDDDMEELADTFRKVDASGMMVRVCINVTNMISWLNPYKTLRSLERRGVRQVLFRNIAEPERVIDTNESNAARTWISANCDEARYRVIKESLTETGAARKIRDLPFGVSVWSCLGLAIAFSDYCMQESSGEDDIRSLIFREDGHLYTSWSDPASILF